uniref:carbohydate-binding domain-containing protein n=1 Tax=Sphingomonas bacterium TaxID=1895847 RepID=UPI0020C6569A
MKRLVAGVMLLASPVSGRAGPVVPPPLDQVGLDRFAATLGFALTVLDEHPADCPGGKPTCFAADLAITMPASLPDGLDVARPEIRFGFVNGIAEVRDDSFAIRLVNGDLQALTLKPGAHLAAGRAYHVRLIGNGHWFSAYYALPNAYVTAEGLAGRVIAATRARVDAETGLETLPFVAPMTDEARLTTQAPDDATRWLTPERAFALYAARGAPATPDVAILPTPLRATRPGGAPVDLSRGVRVTVAG